MEIEILCIGNELLNGFVVNSNAAYISAKLEDVGFKVDRHLTLPDQPDLLLQEIPKAIERSSVLILTGGLGPTLDDHTKEVIYKLFPSEKVRNIEIEKDLLRRYQNHGAMKKQAMIPKNAQAIANHVGVAPGLIYSLGEKILIVLPGVPSEMHPMFLEAVSVIQKKFAQDQKYFPVSLSVCMLPEVKVDPFLRKLQKEYPEVDVGIYSTFGIVHVRFHGKTELTDLMRKKFEKEFSEYIFPGENLAQAVCEEFIKREQKLALAESCSGGSLAAALTAIPKASEYLLGSVVSYSNEMKRDFLGVSQKLLETKGAVSLEVVVQMAEGLFEKTECDYAIAISGIAGPDGGTSEKPVGSVFFAIGKKGEGVDAGLVHIKGDRKNVIAHTVNYALGALWRRIKMHLRTFQNE